MFYDVGLTARYENSQLRLEVDGADAAHDFLRGHGISESGIETVWNAVAANDAIDRLFMTDWCGRIGFPDCAPEFLRQDPTTRKKPARQPRAR